MEQLVLVAARVTVGFRDRLDLPTHAARALARGLDSPTLREVAALGPTGPARELFAEALRELGADWPDEPTAHLLLAREAASAILAVGGGDTVGELAESVYFHLAHAHHSPEHRLDFRFSAGFLVGDAADVRARARALLDALPPTRSRRCERRGARSAPGLLPRAGFVPQRPSASTRRTRA